MSLKNTTPKNTRLVSRFVTGARETDYWPIVGWTDCCLVVADVDPLGAL